MIAKSRNIQTRAVISALETHKARSTIRIIWIPSYLLQTIFVIVAYYSPNKTVPNKLSQICGLALPNQQVMARYFAIARHKMYIPLWQ